MKHLESTDYYNIKYRNFSNKIIIPIFILLVIAIFILWKTPKIVQVETTGTITPTETLQEVKIEEEKKIKKNNIKESREVSKGDTLIEYNDGTKVKSISNGVFITTNSKEGEVFPKKNKELNFTSYINPQQISQVKSGQKVSIQYGDDFLSGKVFDVDTVGTIVEEEMVYKVEIRVEKIVDNSQFPYFSTGNMHIQVDKMSFIEFLMSFM